jgi:NitT/TauT family transport system substrate-binding protein
VQTDRDVFLSNLIQDKYYNEVLNKLDADPDWIPPAVNGSLRFGYIGGNIHYLAMYVAQKEGYFEKIGLVPGKNLLIHQYRSGLAITNAFEHREVDAATMGTPPLLRYTMNNNGKVKIISGMNSGGTSLVVRSDSGINSIEELRGSRIATPGFGSCQDVILRRMFEGFEIRSV